LIAAAEVEVGAVAKLAAAVKTAAADTINSQKTSFNTEVTSDAADRDDHGRFTTAHNGRRREGTEPGQADDRWRGDAHKASHRELSEIQLLKTKPQYLAARLMAMGTTSLLTERRGGLDGPAGAWLAVYGATAYMPATIKRSLSCRCSASIRRCGPPMHDAGPKSPSDGGRLARTGHGLLFTRHHGSAHKFALSGKVSRGGRVMPCLTRVVIRPGVPLLVETHAGTASLKKRLLPVLAELDEAIGPDADVGRLTVIDSEVGVAGLLWAMHEQTQTLFITIIKGAVLKGATFSDEGEWQPFRERDEVRDVAIWLNGKGAPADGITIRGVQMRRPDGRNPKMTVFVTNVPADELSPAEIPSLYLERWPCQEAQFANGRNGGGLNRSFGYGGELVTHVALEGKVERAQRSVAYAEKRSTLAVTQHEALVETVKDQPTKVLKTAVKQAESLVKERHKQVQRRVAQLAQLQTHPKQIYQRDTARDSVMTCLKVTVLSLVEFVMQEYFGGSRMQWRTFIEQFVALPVTIRTSKYRRVFEVQANVRQLPRMAQLQAAFIEVNCRKLKQGDKLLVFELVGMPEVGGVQRSG